MKNKLILIIGFILLSISFLGNNKSDSLLKVIATSQVDSIVSDAYLNLAREYALNNPKLALSYINKSIERFKRFSSDFQYQRLLKKSEIFRLLGEIDSCLYYVNKIYREALKNNKFYSLSACYGEYGLLDIAQGNSQKAIEQFTKQLTIIKKK